MIIAIKIDLARIIGEFPRFKLVVSRGHPVDVAKFRHIFITLGIKYCLDGDAIRDATSTLPLSAPCKYHI